MPKILIKSPREIELMRESCRIVAEVLALVGTRVGPGVLTRELDELAEDWIRSRDAEPAFKGYGSDKRNLFPASLCVSIDDEVVHGIPDGRVLEEGQIVSIDVGVKKSGYYGDGAKTFAVGMISEKKSRLLAITEESLFKGIEQARAGNHLHDVSYAVQQCVEASGFNVVRDLVGHGIGRDLHEEPPVPNYVERNGPNHRLTPGMVLAIEPMITAGDWNVEMARDGWTALTRDRQLAAHFELSVAVTRNGPWILGEPAPR